MKKIYYLFATLFVANYANSQILYSEDFSGTGGSMPAGITLINVDGLTPTGNTSFVTDAWVVSEDQFGSTDTCAVSNSWYTPAGTADDWMITPQINGVTNMHVVSWKAVAVDANYPDGYEVWATSSIAGATPVTSDFTTNGSMIFSTNAENNTWTTRTASLSIFAGASVWIAFRNNSTDDYLLQIDSIVVYTPTPHDASMLAVNTPEYTTVPLPHVTENIGTLGQISNVGDMAVTGAYYTVNVFDGTMNNIYTENSNTVSSLAAGSDTILTTVGYLPTAADLYTVEMISNIIESDGDTLNDTYRYFYLVSDSIYARDNSQISVALGIGVGNGGELGQLYTLATPDDLSSITTYINGSDMQGSRLSAVVYDVVNNTPTTVLALTDTIILPAVDSLYNLTFPCGSVNITSDSIAVLIHEHVGDSTLRIGATAGIFKPATTYINWPTIPTFPYDHNENFGYNVSYIIRPNFGTPTPTLNNNVTVSNDTITALESSSGVSYQWIDCGNNNAIIPSATNQTFVAPGNGDYAVIVSSDCYTDTSACTNIVITSVNENFNISDNVSVYPNPSKGDFTVTFKDVTATNLTLEVVDVTGKIVMTKNLININNNFALDVTNIKAGTYFIKVTGNDFKETRRFVVLK